MSLKQRLFAANTIHQCLYVLYFVLHHTGCLCFKIEKGMRIYYTRWSYVYTNIVRFLLLASFMGGLAIKVKDEEQYEAMVGHLSPVSKFVLCFECTISTLIYTQIAFSFDFKRMKHLAYCHRLQSLDNLLLKDFPCVQWNYDKSSRKFNALGSFVGFYFIGISLGFVFYLSHCSCGWQSSILIGFSYACMTCGPGTACFLFVAGMDMIRIRFRLIYKLLQISFGTSRPSLHGDVTRLRKLKLLQYYFQEYSSMIPTINEIFSNVSGTGSFHDFAMLTNMGFMLFSLTMGGKARPYEYIYTVLFMVPRFYKILMIAVYGRLALTSRRNCDHAFFQMGDYFSKPHLVRENLESFLHWRMHNNYYFSIGKIIRCDLSVLFMIFNSIANYMIILIQLQLQQNTISKTMRKDVELIST
ncbi:putative gustatory receptor 47b [Stomoxys calcitrans]|uniref:putative gustatory receptor 47b n=1 Tax=Stomoxys calcitrans TaxID=35570 RepID=UPI0027E23BEF|nr:putative gustatory receptor 47b [Stomoxys calcitrans]